ncbi:hypothetical protein BJY04DRAFT_199911 [Aspergillus karnatakaensis]|uniref:Zn(II)2Cys6 transcription factor domain-containing protein n=1 Tax=Aspergillus karnatakaensis TaxID=1810916 RepID=UPI003CCD5977
MPSNPHERTLAPTPGQKAYFTESALHPRATKASTACIQCRKRRSKCTGDIPCDACRHQGTNCVRDEELDGRRKIGVKRKVELLEQEITRLRLDKMLLDRMLRIIRESSIEEVDHLLRLIQRTTSLDTLRSHLCEDQGQKPSAKQGLADPMSSPESMQRRTADLDPRQGMDWSYSDFLAGYSGEEPSYHPHYGG